MNSILLVALLLSATGQKSGTPSEADISARTVKPTGATQASKLADHVSGWVNVRSYGAKGDGVTDDTGAIQAAINASFVAEYVNGSTVGLTKDVLIPAGTYLVQGTLTAPTKYLRIRSPDHAVIVQGTPGATTLSFAPGYMVQVSGLIFYGGATAIHFENNNLDTVNFTIEDCEFHEITGTAITITPTAPATHLSTYAVIKRCRFIDCAKGLLTYADQTDVTDTWVTWDGGHAAPNTAFFETHNDNWSGGYLVLDHVFTVPQNTSGIAGLRWVNNYGSVFANRCRFGGESAGISIVYNYSPPSNTNPFVGSRIIIRDSDVWSAGSGSTSGIVVLATDVPGLLVLDGLSGPIDVPYINNQGIGSLASYLSAYGTSQIRIHVGPQLPSSQNDPTVNGPQFPTELKPYVTDLASPTIKAAQFSNRAADAVYLLGNSADGPSAVGVKLGNATTLNTTGAKIVTFHRDAFGGAVSSVDRDGTYNTFGGVAASTAVYSTNGYVSGAAQNLVRGVGTIGYPGNNLDVSYGNFFTWNAIDNAAATVQYPINGRAGQAITIRIKNTSGGAITQPAFNSGFKFAGAVVYPATGYSRSYTFANDGTGWYEVTRSAADVPN